jgi:Fur family peroxide stress response transcriptional regulator
VEAIHRQLIQDYPNISLATVYRNVILLKELGEVLELGFADDGNRYDGNNPRPHPHLICIRCRRILDPDLPDLKEASDRLANETGFEILSHGWIFSGSAVLPGEGLMALFLSCLYANDY